MENQKYFIMGRHGRSVYGLSEMSINTGMTDHAPDRNPKHFIKWVILKNTSLISSQTSLLKCTKLRDHPTGRNDRNFGSILSEHDHDTHEVSVKRCCF